MELLGQMEFLTALADATPTLLVVVESADGSLTRDPVNSAYKELTGFSTEECAAVSFWGKVHPEDADSARAAFNTVVSTRRPASRISQWLKKDGSTFECEWTCTPLPPLGLGRMRPYLITGIDLTERRRQEREVTQSRARIVAAADQERRRLERNLHDGAQQRLVSLSLCLRLAQAKLASAPDDAHTILDSAAGELQLALTELRELARGLHPAVLSDLGLHSALRGLTQRTPVPVELDVAVEGRLPEQLEVALFYVVSETLTNVAKYAHATSASVSVVVEGPFVTAAISDDGIGGADARNGSGLTGLADRVAASTER